MTDPSGYAKTLALPAGFDAPRLLRYDDVTAHAITRDDLGADVRGINASLDLIRETRGGLSRHPTRQALAQDFGATDILAERGDAVDKAVLDLTDGIGVDATLECVGTRESVSTAFAIARPGSTVGIVGVPHDVEVPFTDAFFRNVGWHGDPNRRRDQAAPPRRRRRRPRHPGHRRRDHLARGVIHAAPTHLLLTQRNNLTVHELGEILAGGPP